MHFTIRGDDKAGYWVNLGPGLLRLGAVYPTRQEAVSTLAYHQRTCGAHCPIATAA